MHGSMTHEHLTPMSAAVRRNLTVAATFGVA